MTVADIHPALPTFIAIALMLWPLMRLYARVGLPRAWALLLFASLLIPLLGMVLALLPLAVKPWPRFPKAVPPEKPRKVAI